jgi:hypothetical protein
MAEEYEVLRKKIRKCLKNRHFPQTVDKVAHGAWRHGQLCLQSETSSNDDVFFDAKNKQFSLSTEYDSMPKPKTSLYPTSAALC